MALSTDRERQLLNHYRIATLHPERWPHEDNESSDEEDDEQHHVAVPTRQVSKLSINSRLPTMSLRLSRVVIHAFEISLVGNDRNSLPTSPPLWARLGISSPRLRAVVALASAAQVTLSTFSSRLLSFGGSCRTSAPRTASRTGCRRGASITAK